MDSVHLKVKVRKLDESNILVPDSQMDKVNDSLKKIKLENGENGTLLFSFISIFLRLTKTLG